MGQCKLLGLLGHYFFVLDQSIQYIDDNISIISIQCNLCTSYSVIVIIVDL